MSDTPIIQHNPIFKNPRKPFTRTKEKKGNRPDTSGGYKYLKLDRMAYYVHKQTYLNQLDKHIKMIQKS